MNTDAIKVPLGDGMLEVDEPLTLTIALARVQEAAELAEGNARILAEEYITGTLKYSEESSPTTREKDLSKITSKFFYHMKTYRETALKHRAAESMLQKMLDNL